jgi:hypothetical protein
MHRIITAALLATLPLAGLAQDEDKSMKINVIAGGIVMPATLDDTSAARDFAAMLPLDLVLSDYHGIEKVADLGRRLDASDAPPSYEPKAGDITQYAPWKNLAIFTAPFSDSRGLVRLGQFDGAFDALKQPGEIAVRIEAAD